MARDYAPKTLNGIATQVAKDVYKKVGNRIAKDMTHQYVSAIRNFYNDYQPRVYKRSYRSYYFADPDGVKAYTKFVKMDSDGKGFTVAMNISPSNIRVPYTSIVNGRGTASLTGLVFTNTWVYGRHGGKLPYNIIPEEKRVSKPGYGWIPLKQTGWTWIPPVTSPSPMEMMDMWFKGYATNDNLNKLTSNIVSDSISRYLRRWNTRYGK